MKISSKWKRMAEIYKSFSLIGRTEGVTQSIIDRWDEYDSYRDFSDEAMEEAYRLESFGEAFEMRRPNGLINGYIEGKKWMDLTITEYWLPDLESREMYAFELYQDFPRWFIDKILPEKFRLNDEDYEFVMKLKEQNEQYNK